MWWVAAAMAGGAPETIHPGEFYGQTGGWTGSAYTTPKGELALHPFVRSSFGLAEWLDLKAPILGQIVMPQLGMEVAFVQNERLALSLEGEAQVPWGLGWANLGVVPHASFRPSPGVMIDLSVGVHGMTRDRTIVATGTPLVLEEGGVTAVRPELSLDLRLSESTWLVTTGRSDVHGWATRGIPQGAVGAYFAHGKKGFGCSAGANVTVVGLGGVQEQLAVLEGEIDPRLSLPRVPDSLVVPSPHLQMWFRI